MLLLLFLCKFKVRRGSLMCYFYLSVFIDDTSKMFRSLVGVIKKPCLNLQKALFGSRTRLCWLISIQTVCLQELFSKLKAFLV